MVPPSRVSQWRRKLGSEVDRIRARAAHQSRLLSDPDRGGMVFPLSSFLYLCMAGARDPDYCPEHACHFIRVGPVCPALGPHSGLNDNSGSILSLFMVHSSAWRLLTQLYHRGPCSGWKDSMDGGGFPPVKCWLPPHTAGQPHVFPVTIYIELYVSCIIGSSGTRASLVIGISAKTELPISLSERPTALPQASFCS